MIALPELQPANPERGTAPREPVSPLYLLLGLSPTVIICLAGWMAEKLELDTFMSFGFSVLVGIGILSAWSMGLLRSANLPFSEKLLLGAAIVVFATIANLVLSYGGCALILG